jgi:hypothetical protein
MLRFAAAAEILETDFWEQYNELGKDIQDKEVPGGSGNPAYTAALSKLDSDKAGRTKQSFLRWHLFC